MTICVFSFGGGVQSVAALVLASQGKIDFRSFVFANVGEDSEYPGTLTYLEAHAKPFAAAHGLELVEVQKTKPDGTPETVLARARQHPSRIGIPVHMATSGLARRACTADFKIEPVARWLKARGATAADPATVGLGISVDEASRMRKTSSHAWTQTEYPLIFPHRLTRTDCQDVIRGAGLPLPPKSACWFCPYHRVGEWRRLRREEPALFAQAVVLEQELRAKRARRGLDDVWLSDARRPLDEAFPDDGGQLSFLDDESNAGACETGYCMT